AAPTWVTMTATAARHAHRSPADRRIARRFEGSRTRMHAMRFGGFAVPVVAAFLLTGSPSAHADQLCGCAPRLVGPPPVHPPRVTRITVNSTPLCSPKQRVVCWETTPSGVIDARAFGLACHLPNPTGTNGVCEDTTNHRTTATPCNVDTDCQIC